LEREFFRIKEKLNDIMGVLFWENYYEWDQFQSVKIHVLKSSLNFENLQARQYSHAAIANACPFFKSAPFFLPRNACLFFNLSFY
jgi:hypothetical protein